MTSNHIGHLKSIYSGAIKIATLETADRFLVSLVRVCFFGTANLYWLTAVSCLLLLSLVWLMLSPGVIYSKAMTWDLLFILEGAWRIYSGQILHVDFHYPIGTLTFLITILGFALVGIKPIAFIVGECTFAAVFTAVSILGIKDRLPILPAILFILMCVVLILVPGNTGDDVRQYTFAMSYNRFGWSIISLLFLLLFIEPRKVRYSVIADLSVGFLLILALFYLKISYFGVGVAAISLALFISRHVRRYWLAWSIMLLLVILVALAPMNDGYRADIISAVADGRINSDARELTAALARNSVELCLGLAGVLALLYLVRQRSASFGDVVCGLFILVAGFLLLSQNAQARSMPLYGVLGLLLFVRLADRPPLTIHHPSVALSFLLTCTLFPVLQCQFVNILTMVAYNMKAGQISQAFVVERTNLQGLSVPEGSRDDLEEVGAEWFTRGSSGSIHSGTDRPEFSEREYVNSILNLVDLLKDKDAASARIVVIDQVNPLPFVLGATPPRGGNLWSGDLTWQRPEEAFREADYVAIPRFPTHRETLFSGLKAYGEYLLTRFVQRYETPYWTVLKRANAMPGS
jgi:hypothetical protein